MQIKRSKAFLLCIVLFLFLMTAGISSAVPELAHIYDITITENELLSFTVYATDTDTTATIVYSAENLPVGATLDMTTGVFIWTPGAGTAGSYIVKFIATANGETDEETVTIIVRAVNKNELINAINSANAKLSSAVPGTEIGQYPQSAINAFQTAISAAQAVADNTAAMQSQVDQAVTNLQAAEATFDAARITSIDKSALTSAIVTANQKVTNADAGTGIGQYPQASIDAFKAAIATAQAVADNPNATNAEVSQAVTALRAAEATFDAARQTPPASVTNLRETATGTSWIRWAWTNPNDADFSNVMIYIDGVLVTSTSNNFYNSTGLPEGTVHTIGTQTVDTAGNINPSTVTDQATTKVADRTPPAPVTNLQENGVGPTWIRWTWTNPIDDDFSHVMVYIDGTFITSISDDFYNATGLSEGTLHAISIETVDNAGNINSVSVADSVTTVTEPRIFSASTKGLTTSSIELTWEASEDTTTVQILRNNIILEYVTESTSYVDSNLASYTIYNYTLVPYNKDGIAGQRLIISGSTISTTIIDKKALIIAIADANAKVGSAISGIEIGQYPQSSIDSFKIAINKAQAVFDNGNASQEEINQALIDLAMAEATFDAERITTVDRTPPASVTNLRETVVGLNLIRWTWVNPMDVDFKHVMVHIDGQFVTNTSDEFYTAAGLTEGTLHTISIKTVDTSGNINPVWVSDSATTATTVTTYLTISGLSGQDLTSNSITLTWTNSPDITIVEIYRNNVVVGNVSGLPSYVDNSLASDTTYSYTLIPYNKDGLAGKAVTISLKTKAVSSGGSGGGSSNKKSSGGGGGGAGSVEDYSNVAVKDVDSEYLRMNAYVTYEFSRPGNDIQSISFYSLKNSGEITSTIEMLNGRSKLASNTPGGLIYKYVNIWVGKAGFATAANIEDSRIKFKVNSFWIQQMGVSPSDIRLQRYNGTAWEVLPTTFESNITDYAIFESRTPGFSPFAITAEKELAYSVNSDSETDYVNTADTAMEETQPKKSNIWTFIMVILIIGVLAVGYEYLKRK